MKPTIPPPPSPRLVFAASRCALADPAPDSPTICEYGWLCEQRGGIRIAYLRPCPHCNTPNVSREAMLNAWRGQAHDAVLEIPDPDKSLENYFADTPAIAEIVERCWAYVRGFETNMTGSGIVLIGLTGRGKSHLANGLWLALIEYYPVLHGASLWLSGSDLLSLVRDEYAEDTDRREVARAWLVRLRTISLLILDDLGSEGSLAGGSTSEAFARTLHHIADTRYRAKLPTIVTANLSLDGVRTRYGEPLTRRIVAGADVISFASVPVYQRPAQPPVDHRAAASGEREDENEMPF